VAGAVNMKDLFFAFKGKFENFNLSFFNYIKPVSLISFMEDDLAPVKLKC